ncbi:MAG: PD-(D/E)XK nuclease domain-containing protein [Candidatus Riflebacteria bacterium]|nr:PD-(D/E)XK nuclease domain-containing protein [Candidatus Riflebacteria bacterium]
MILYFLIRLQKSGEYPDEIIEKNVQTDFNKLDYLTQLCSPSGGIYNDVMEILQEGEVVSKIEERLRLKDLLNINYIYSLMYYMGLLTISGNTGASSNLRIPNYVIKTLFWEYLRTRLEKFSSGITNFRELQKTINALQIGQIKPFAEYIFRNVAKIFSNIDLLHANEQCFKSYFFALVSLDSSYIIFSETEMARKHSDIILKRNPRYPEIKYNWLIELKYLPKEAKKSEIEYTIAEGKEQIAWYKNDKKWHESLTTGGATLKSLVLLYIDAESYQIIDCDKEGEAATYLNKSQGQTAKERSKNKTKPLQKIKK